MKLLCGNSFTTTTRPYLFLLSHYQNLGINNWGLTPSRNFDMLSIVVHYSTILSYDITIRKGANMTLRMNQLQLSAAVTRLCGSESQHDAVYPLMVQKARL